MTTDARALSMEELATEYNVEAVVENNGDPFVVVTPRQLSEPDMREIGTSSPSPWTSFIRQEYNPQLQGIKGLEKYDQMRRSDGTVRGTLRLVKTPVMAARWFMEPGGKLKKDKTIADFCWKALSDMSISWDQFLMEALLMCDFGYYMFEKVWEEKVVLGKRRIVLRKLAPRHPMDVVAWHYDTHGGPSHVEMVPPNMFVASNPGARPFPGNGVPGGLGSSIGTGLGNVEIPIDKLLVFTFDREAGNLEGMSLLRPAFKHWFYKDNLYKIDAIQKERHGIGIPVIKLPMGFSPNDRALANEMGRNLRTNERAHIVLPPNWEILMLKLEGQPVNALESADHHDLRIEKSILASFISATAAGKQETALDMFLKSTRFIASTVASTINSYLIPQLVDYNFPNVKAYPKLRARRIGETADWRTLSFALRNLIGANVIRPDDVLEENIRDEMDLPPVDEATVRETATPQMPEGDGEDGEEGDTTKPGLPRQKPSPPVGAPRGNAGTDRSGG